MINYYSKYKKYKSKYLELKGGGLLIDNLFRYSTENADILYLLNYVKQLPTNELKEYYKDIDDDDISLYNQLIEGYKGYIFIIDNFNNNTKKLNEQDMINIKLTINKIIELLTFSITQKCLFNYIKKKLILYQEMLILISGLLSKEDEQLKNTLKLLNNSFNSQIILL